MTESLSQPDKHERSVDRNGRCSLCGGTHYGSLDCPYRCGLCSVNTDPCTNSECQRNARWAAQEAEAAAGRAAFRNAPSHALRKECCGLGYVAGVSECPGCPHASVPSTTRRTSPLRTCGHGVVYGDPCRACLEEAADMVTEQSAEHAQACRHAAVALSSTTARSGAAPCDGCSQARGCYAGTEPCQKAPKPSGETPRTDAYMRGHGWESIDGSRQDYPDLSAFARQLERELAEAERLGHLAADNCDEALQRAEEAVRQRDTALSAIAQKPEPSNVAIGHDAAQKRIEECVREIEILCDTFGYDPVEWLSCTEDYVPSRTTDGGKA